MLSKSDETSDIYDISVLLNIKKYLNNSYKARCVYEGIHDKRELLCEVYDRSRLFE